MNSKIMKFVLVISLLLNFSLLLSAGYSYYRHSQFQITPFDQERLKGRHTIESISLRPEQRETIRGKALAFHADMDKKRQEVARKRLDLISLLRAETPDRKAIDTAIAEISSMQKDLQVTVAYHMLDIRTVLDKEQQKKFFNLIEGAMSEKGQMPCPW